MSFSKYLKEALERRYYNKQRDLKNTRNAPVGGDADPALDRTGTRAMTEVAAQDQKDPMKAHPRVPTSQF
jgi:hypothetical protein